MKEQGPCPSIHDLVPEQSTAADRAADNMTSSSPLSMANWQARRSLPDQYAGTNAHLLRQVKRAARGEPFTKARRSSFTSFAARRSFQRTVTLVVSGWESPQMQGSVAVRR